MPSHRLSPNPKFWASFVQRWQRSVAGGAAGGTGWTKEIQSSAAEAAIWPGIPEQYRREVWSIVSADSPIPVWKSQLPADHALASELDIQLQVDLISGHATPERVEKVRKILAAFTSQYTLGRFAEGAAELLLRILDVTQGDESEAYAVFHKVISCLQVFITPQEFLQEESKTPQSSSVLEASTGSEMNTQLHTDVLILAHYIVEDIPKLASHLDRFRLDVTDLLEVFQQWNGALFATHFRSRSFVYRILDLILLGQHRGITAVVYGLLKVNAPRLLELDEFDSIYTAMASLGEPEREDAAGLAAFDALINLAFEEGYFSVVGNSKRRQELDGFRSTKSWSHVCADAGPVFFVQGVGSPGPALKALEEERTRRLKADQQQSHFMQQLSQQDDSMSGDSLFGPDYFSDRDTLTPLSSASPRLSTTSFPPGPLTPQQQRGSSATWSSRRPESHSPSLALATLSEDRPSGSTLPRGGLGARASRVGTLFGGLHRPRVSNSNFFPQLPPPDLEPVLESLTSVLQQKGSSLDEEQRTVLQQALDTVTDYQTNRAGRPGSLPPTPAHQQQQSGSGIPTSRPSAAAAAAAGTPLGRRTSKMVEVQPDGGLVLRLPGEKGRIEPAKKGTVPESGIVKHSALHEYLTFPCLYMEGLLLKARGKKQGLFGSRNLQLRFFVLQGRFLSYFRSKDSRKPNKDISLDMQGRKILVLKHHEFGQNGFQINHANGVPALLLFADTQHIRDVWVSVLQCAAQLPD